MTKGYAWTKECLQNTPARRALDASDPDPRDVIRARNEAIMSHFEQLTGVVFHDSTGVTWTGDGLGNITPDDGRPTMRVRDVIRIR